MALKRDLLKAALVKQPGVRGGKWYETKSGKIRYGDKPTDRDEVNRRAKGILDELTKKKPGKGKHIALTREQLEECLKSGKYALVSAGPNPNHEPDKNLSADEIKRRHEQLGRDLIDKGYMFTNVTGHYGGIEDSYLVMVHDADRKDVVELGKKYNQDSVIYGEAGRQEMHFTFGAHVGTMHTGEGYEVKQDADDFFTVVHHPDGSSTKFALNFDWDTYHQFAKALMALFLKAVTKPDDEEPTVEGEEGPNDHLGEEPIDAPVGYSPRIVKVPMHQNADMNPEVHEAKMEKKKARAAQQPVEKALSKPLPEQPSKSMAAPKPASTQLPDEVTMKSAKPIVKKATATEYGSIGTSAPAPPPPPKPTSTPTPAPPPPKAMAIDAPAPPQRAMAIDAPVESKRAVAINAPVVKAIADTIEKAQKKGPGSRGGKVVRHTKSGKPVYESQAKKHADSAEQMMNNWHQNATKSGDPEHHAVAAKQALNAAFFHHHAGNNDAASQAMDYANHHRAQYERKGHGSRTANAVAKIHGETADLVGSGHWQPTEHGLSEEHAVAHDADLSKDHETAKKIRSVANSKTKADATILGHTSRGHAVHRLSDTHIEAMRGYNKHNFNDITEAEHAAHRKATKQHHVKHGNYAGWTKDDHREAADIYNKHNQMLQEKGAHSQTHEVQAHRGLTHDHSRFADVRGEHHYIHGAVSKEADERVHNVIHGKKLKKAIKPSNSHGGNMSKNEVADLFKSELGEENAHLTNCVHCNHSLTKSDLKKGLGTSFVADDNDNPSDGGSGQVEPSRGVPGAKENDEIAPLLKGLKGAEAGDKEEFPISKSEMLSMGMNADDLDEGWYTITKSEMQRLAPEHLPYLVDRKNRVVKSMSPNVIRKSTETVVSARTATDGPHGYSPRAGGAVGNGGNPLVEWSAGSDAEVAKYIEKSGGYGPGTDESIRTQGRGY